MLRLAIIRRGHIGDIVLMEPIVDALRATYPHVTLFTDYPRAAELLGVFDEVLPYDEHSVIATGDFDRTICLKYEIYPGAAHLDGYARNAGVVVHRRVPRLRQSLPPIYTSPYGLVAPAVSTWIRRMRQWPAERFQELSLRLTRTWGTPIVTLETSHTFDEMVSLLQHCTFFIGNDSGPAIIAQCFGRPSFVICGATNPRLVLLDPSAVGITKDVGCNGCKHFARHTDIECASPICLDELTVDDVLDQITRSGFHPARSTSPYRHH